MPNLMLTNRCNFHCSYCFGVDIMHPVSDVVDMSCETFVQLITWLKKAHFPGNSVHLMGGEPTLNKDFVWMAKTVKANGFDLAIFSNAATSKAPEYADCLKNLAIRWIVNVNPPDSRTIEEDNRLKESLKILADKATLTFNMILEPCENEWTIELICQYKLNKKIKVGFVLPALSHRNEHLSKEDYPRVAHRVVEFARLTEKFGISLEYECGIPWCVFDDKQMGELWSLNSRFFSSCDSILDITPQGSVIYCLPLATLHSLPFHQFNNYPEAKAFFESKLTPYRPLGTTPNCFSCHLMWSGHCRGGCLARILGNANNIKKGEQVEQSYVSIS